MKFPLRKEKAFFIHDLKIVLLFYRKENIYLDKIHEIKQDTKASFVTMRQALQILFRIRWLAILKIQNLKEKLRKCLKQNCFKKTQENVNFYVTLNK